MPLPPRGSGTEEPDGEVRAVVREGRSIPGPGLPAFCDGDERLSSDDCLRMPGRLPAIEGTSCWWLVAAHLWTTRTTISGDTAIDPRSSLPYMMPGIEG